MKQSPSKRMLRRSGLLKVEAMIAAVVLVAAMNFASIAIHRINGVWDQTRRYQFAINELSNELDSLIDLSAADAAAKLETLTPSPDCMEVLSTPRFTSTISDDPMGTRITLMLAWKENQPNAPQLSAWLRNTSGPILNSDADPDSDSDRPREGAIR